jgi:flagellar hook assembly protein FlgD
LNENDDLFINGNKVVVRPTIGKSFEFVCKHKLPGALKIYNSAGKLVWSKKISAKEPVAIKWYGTNQFGRSLSPGVYLLRYGDITKQVILTN